MEHTEIAEAPQNELEAETDPAVIAKSEARIAELESEWEDKVKELETLLGLVQLMEDKAKEYAATWDLVVKYMPSLGNSKDKP